jgi:hypothetical protein
MRQQRDQPRHVHSLLALGECAADDHVLDVLGRHAGARDQRLDHLRRQIVGPHLGERALVREVERRASKPGDHDVFLHRVSPWRRGRPQAAAIIGVDMGNPSIQIDRRAIVRSHD